MQPPSCSSREFIRRSALLTAFASASPSFAASLSPELRANAKVAIVGCKTYGAEVKPALKQCFDLIGGKGLAGFGRERGERHHAIGGPGDDLETVLGEFTRKITREIGAGEIKQLSGLLGLGGGALLGAPLAAAGRRC